MYRIMDSETDVLFRIQPNWKTFSVLTCAGENPLITFMKGHLIIEFISCFFCERNQFQIVHVSCYFKKTVNFSILIHGNIITQEISSLFLSVKFLSFF